MALADRINFDDVYFSLPRLKNYMGQMESMHEVLAKSGILKRDQSLQRYALTVSDTIAHGDVYQPKLSSGATNYDATLTNTIECYDQKNVVLGRKYSFSTDALASCLSKGNPEKEVAKFLNYYSQQIRTYSLIKALTGVSANSGMTDQVYNISTGSTISDANRLTTALLQAGIQTKFGDKYIDNLVMICHSAQFGNMLSLGTATYSYDPVFGKVMPKACGMNVIINDVCPTAANSTYSSFILGRESIICAEALESNTVAIANDSGYSSTGRQYLVAKERYIAQPAGVGFTGTPAGVSPTDTELATNTNWTLVFTADTYVPIIKVIANI